MKRMKRVIAGLITSIMIVSCLVGCGGSEDKKKGGTSKTDIQISVWNSGLGTEWLDAMIEAFKEVHPEYNVYYDASATRETVIATYGMEELDTVDIYMSEKMSDYTYMEPLNDVVESQAEGDSKTLKEKFHDSYLAEETAKDGNIYSLTFGSGIVGIVYNKELFKQADITQLPRTTNELAVVCSNLYSQNITPLCHYGGSGYWHFLEECWYGQYEGADYYRNTFYGNPTKETMLKQDGRYEILKSYEKFIKPEYILTGSNSSDHTTMQTKFVLGEAAMMVNGSWLASEMSASGSVENFETMKLPVLSAITDKLTTVKKESELKKLIDAIDAVTEGEKKLEEYKSGDGYLVDGQQIAAEDWDYVYAARNTVAGTYATTGVVIPKYSVAKEGAKEFLKFMYSDAGYQIYANNLHIQLPIDLSAGEIDKTEWSDFEKNQAHLIETSVQSFSKGFAGKHELFRYGGASLYAGVPFINYLSAKNAADRITADEAWQQIVDMVNDKYESTWLNNIK